MLCLGRHNGVAGFLTASHSCENVTVHLGAGIDAGSTGEGIMVVDMGTHVLSQVQGAHSLIQIAVPGLEERIRFLPALRSIQMSPGGSQPPLRPQGA